jgi:hypothetical protein
VQLESASPGLGPPERVSELAELWAAIEDETEARQRVEQEIAALRTELARLRGAETKAAPGPMTSEGASDPHSERPWFNAEGLLSAGVDPAEVRELRNRFEEIELERLYLRDRAAREEWTGSRRYREESAALDARFRELREELGTDSYDRLLYATGRPNRARIRDVLERSPASEAGVLAGDVILSYDRRRIFTVGELRRATTEGQAGAQIEVIVERNGKAVHLWIPRGPLGVRLAPARRPPWG